MLNILSLKKKQQQQVKKTTSAQLRIQKDLSELSVPKTMKLEVGEDVLNLSLLIMPDDGMYIFD
jgi:ubiquitin-conjugating enzyme E2 M